MEKDIAMTLNQPLDKKHISIRDGRGGTKLSYVKGWHVISEMNRIFGFNNWSVETISMQEIVNRKYTNQYKKEMYEVGYVAKVKIRIRIEPESGQAKINFHEGTGTGNGIANKLYDAYESAIKEAETDALKRACKNFGNVMGLALYDTAQVNVKDYDAELQEEQDEITKVDKMFYWLKNKIINAKSKDDLDKMINHPKAIKWTNLVMIRYQDLFWEMQQIMRTKMDDLNNNPNSVTDPPSDKSNPIPNVATIGELSKQILSKVVVV